MRIKPYGEQSIEGSISFEQNIKFGTVDGILAIQICEDGRVWICVDGKALIIFKPTEKQPTM